METIMVMPANTAEYSLVMQLLEKMRIAFTPTRETTLAESVPRRMTMGEFRAMIDASLEDERNGRVHSQAEVEKMAARW